ncbi:MAG: TetR/AcrR family transcriptional regulator [Candidatus Sumerlaeia bacterium]
MHQQNHDQEISVKERIDNCALEFFSTKGYSATSVREIVEAAGVTKPSLYYYYKNKDDLYKTLYSESMSAFMEDLEKNLSQDVPFRQKLLTVLVTYFEWMKRRPHLASFFYRVYFGESPFQGKDELNTKVNKDDVLIREYFMKAVEEKVFCDHIDPNLAATLFLGLIHVFVVRQVIGYQDELTGETAEKVVDYFLNGVLPKESV